MNEEETILQDVFLNLLSSGLSGQKCESFASHLSEEQWNFLFNIAEKQCVIGLFFKGVDLLERPYRPPLNLYALMAIYLEKIASGNVLMNERSAQVCSRLKGMGLRSCILKGQGVASCYKDSSCRQYGDIDVWVDAPAEKVIGILISESVPVRNVFYHHCEAGFFKDTEVEVHFRPSFMNGLLADRRLQEIFRKRSDAQFSNFDNSLGFCVPDPEFSVLHSIVHIFRHLFFEGVGLRQICDLYYLLGRLDDCGRAGVVRDLRSLHLCRFTSSLMWILSEKLGLQPSFLLAEPDYEGGEKLLSEVMASGNFGNYSSDVPQLRDKSIIKRSFFEMRRLARLIRYNPGETLAAPFYKCWQHIWRKQFKKHLK